MLILEFCNCFVNWLISENRANFKDRLFNCPEIRTPASNAAPRKCQYKRINYKIN